MTVLYVASNEIGRGTSELGAILMPAYLNALAKGTTKPEAILFVNSGVKLLAEGSPALDALKELAAGGVKLLGCGTCLDYYDLKDKLAVGGITNAAEITSLLVSADKAVTL